MKADKNPEHASGPGRIRERNKSRILRAAEKLFARQGYEATTTRQIAEAAGLPQANVLYYFGAKQTLYESMLEGILRAWLESFEDFSNDDEPAVALERYIRRKMEYTRTRPDASRIFAMEIIRGAPVLKRFLETKLRSWVEQKTRIFDTWIAEGKMAPVAPVHLLFAIWAITQHYADFETQVTAVTAQRLRTRSDYQAVTDELVGLILRGCGLTPAR